MTLRLTKSMNDMHKLKDYSSKTMEYFKALQMETFKRLIQKYPISSLYFHNTIWKKADRKRQIQYFFRKTRG